MSSRPASGSGAPRDSTRAEVGLTQGVNVTVHLDGSVLFEHGQSRQSLRMVGVPHRGDSREFQDALNYLKRQIYKPPGQVDYSELFVDEGAFRWRGQVARHIGPDNSHLFGEYLESKGFSLDEREAVIRDGQGAGPSNPHRPTGILRDGDSDGVSQKPVPRAPSGPLAGDSSTRDDQEGGRAAPVGPKGLSAQEHRPHHPGPGLPGRARWGAGGRCVDVDNERAVAELAAFRNSAPGALLSGNAGTLSKCRRIFEAMQADAPSRVGSRKQGYMLLLLGAEDLVEFAKTYENNFE